MPHSQADLQEAVQDLHDYLSDHRPPLMVADSVALLLKCPPAFLAAQIQSWVAAQSLAAPVADYLYHGAKKICVMGELDLVEKARLANSLRQLAVELPKYAPDADKELLRQNLERLGQAVVAAPGAPSILHRQAGAQAASGASASTATLTHEVRRLSLLLEHLRPLTSAAASPERRLELASQFMTTAAVHSSSAKELEQHLAPLRELGVETTTEQVFRTLARNLAGWLLPRMEGLQGPVVSREELAAMRQIVSLGEDPAEVAKRFREMVHAAVEQFNEGHLGRAATMFELAQHLAVEEKVKKAFVDPLRDQGHSSLSEERLRKFAERADCRTPLRTILLFFTALQPRGLLKALDGEARRERRHELLALLEVHEQEARSAAWEMLAASVEPGAQVDPFFQMNLVYLLRIVPRPANASVEDEVGVVMRTSGRSSPPPLVKQVIAYLAATRHDKAERALVTYLKVFESMLLEPETAVYSPDDLEMLLDRTCAALARYGTPRAWRLLIDHGLKSEARLGSPFLRLAEAGHVDLSSSKDLVERIIAAIRRELPQSGLLGIVSRRDEEKAASLVRALAGTPLNEVRELLQEIATRYSGRRLGEAANKALASIANVGKPPGSAGLSGDLALFGLPNLLQTISQSELTGNLSILTGEGKTEASLLFEKGRFRGGHCGAVHGEEAVFQLLERPFPGTFAFVARDDVAAQPRIGPPQDVVGLLMEGVRRYDELKRYAAVVPDTAQLATGGKPHSVPQDEDPDLAVLVWNHVGSGRTPQVCESTVGMDSYRVRRLLCHWLEEGALRLA